MPGRDKKESEESNMNPEIWINVEIDYNKHGILNCNLCQQVGDEEMTIEPLPLQDAKRMMWELKLAGGTHEVIVNRFDRYIVTTRTWLILPY